MLPTDLPWPPKMLRSAETPSQKLKPKERRRPTLQHARDYIRDVARINLSSNAAKSKTTDQDGSQPEEVQSDRSCQTESRHAQPPRGSIPNTQIQERSASSTPIGSFTHLRRNAVSDGIPYGDYRYLTGGRSEYECLQDAYRQKGNHFLYAGQERPAQSRNVSTETVWNGDGAAEDFNEKADVSSSVDSDLRKAKERRSSDLEERGMKRQG